MEKIIFNTHEFNLVPVGIAGNDVTKRRSFKFTSELPYQEVENILTNPDNFATIKYQLEDGLVVATYADCVSLKILSKDIETGIYTAEFSTDAVERELAELRATVNVLTGGVANE